MNYILAIDQSTSGTKALLYDANGHCHDRESKEHRQIYPQPGWVEHDLDEIWNNLLAIVTALIGRHPDKTLKCVSITNQRETICLFERGSGRPLHNAIVWQCRRGSEICRNLEEAGHGARVTELTGLRLDTYFSASKLKWLIAQDAGLEAKLESGEAIIGTIDSYLVHRLTEGQIFATDHTNASRTLLYDIGNLCWDESLCELFDVPIAALPEVRESSARFGETTFEGHLPEPVPIFGVMGDSQASLFAQRCYEPGTAKITFGTGSSVLLNIGEALRFSESGSVSTIAWVWQGRPTYSFEGIINYSAASIAWLKDQLGMLQSSAEAGPLAAAVPDNGGVYLIPAFAGLSAPHWKPNARAAIVGLTAHSTRNHIVRAAEESIAYQLHDVLQMMNHDASVSLQTIHADGGPTRDAFLMQFTADLLRIELQVAVVPDCSALGAAMAGMLGCGMRDTLDELATLPRETTTYSPKMDTATVQHLIDSWNDAVPRVF
ncbi:MAG: glycerol kinase GlpK [Verrucomicrobiales bacterium]